MAKGRFVNKSIAIDKKLNTMSFEAEGFYLKTIPHLDRDGLILYGDGHELWAQVCPRRINLLEHVPDFVQEWLDANLVILYDTEEGQVLYFKGFQKNQQGMVYSREAPSSFEPPPGYCRTESGLDRDDSFESSHELVMSESRPNHDTVVPKFKSKSKVKSKVKAKGNGAATGENTERLRKYTDAAGETTNYSDGFKIWFYDFTGRYTDGVFDRAIKSLRKDIASENMGDMSKWDRFRHHLEKKPSKGSPADDWDNVKDEELMRQ